MSVENDTSARFWPATGIWGASYRVMFPLTAIWAMVSVLLWALGAVEFTDLPVSHWHMHEMVFGLGGGALLGYLPSACSSWTARAPVSGWPIAAMVLAWIGARATMFFSADIAQGAIMLATAAPFLILAMILLVEAKRGAKPKIRGFIVFSVLAGVLSAMTAANIAGAAQLAPFLFLILLFQIGGRMAFGFLKTHAQRQGEPEGRDITWPFWLALVCSIVAEVFARKTGVIFLRDAALSLALICLWGRVANWPLKGMIKEPLVFATAVGFLWFVAVSTVAYASYFIPLPFQHNLLHTLIMGPLPSLLMAVMARAYAARTSKGLAARKGFLIAFITLQVAVMMRFLDFLDASAACWVLAWAGFLISIFPGMRGRIPRPIFSGTRQKRPH